MNRQFLSQVIQAKGSCKFCENCDEDKLEHKSLSFHIKPDRRPSDLLGMDFPYDWFCPFFFVTAWQSASVIAAKPGIDSCSLHFHGSSEFCIVNLAVSQVK